jgi:hypothetical protein
MASQAVPAGPTEPTGPTNPIGATEAAKRAPGRSLARLLVLVVAAAACALGAWLGAWWVPFLVGVGAGLFKKARTRLPRGVLWPAVIGSILGWALMLWIMALASLPVGATARVIAALGGLPPYAGVGVAVTLLLAALQVLVGAWLVRAVIPSRTAIPKPGPSDSSEDPPDVRIGQA